MRIRIQHKIFSRHFSNHQLTSNDSIITSNKTLHSLLRSGRLHEATTFFDSLSTRTTATFNTFLSGLIRLGHSNRARKLFDTMPVRDTTSYNTMLLAYTVDNSLFGFAQKMFDEMPVKDVITWNTMLHGYLRVGRMKEAWRVFWGMPERNVTSWNTMVSGSMDNGDVGRAIEVFERMPMRDEASLSALVSGLVKNGRLEEAERVLVENHGMCGFISACNTLIAGYGRLGMVEDAKRTFDLIPLGVGRNVVTWNSMMMCYMKVGDVLSARKLFDEMPMRDLISWNTIISGYANALDVEEADSLFQKMRFPDERTWNFMVSGFTQKGELERACDYFNRMPRKNVVSWNILIAGYERFGDYEGSLRLFIWMLYAGEKPDRHTLSSVLGASAGLASLNLGMQMHQLVTKAFIGDIPINNALITMYARCGNLRDARSVFESMKAKKDYISWNAMIGGYAQHGIAKESLEVFEEMKRMRVQPTHITFVSVLNACCSAGLVVEGQKQFHSMVDKYAITPTSEHYALLVNLIGRNGQLEEAMHIIQTMPLPPDKSVWGAMLDACKLHNNYNLARVVAKEVMEVDPDSAGAHVQLYNMYANKGWWDDATKAREVLDKSGIRKQPGYSWIELHDTVNIFVAGDRSHPLSKELYDIIDTYERITRDEHIICFPTAIGV